MLKQRIKTVFLGFLLSQQNTLALRHEINIELRRIWMGLDLFIATYLVNYARVFNIEIPQPESIFYLDTLTRKQQKNMMYFFLFI